MLLGRGVCRVEGVLVFVFFAEKVERKGSLVGEGGGRRKGLWIDGFAVGDM